MKLRALFAALFVVTALTVIGPPARVASDAELQGVYDALSSGGTPFTRSGYNGTWIRRSDGVEIGLRNASRSGGRTIDIRMPDGSIQKVHIE